MRENQELMLAILSKTDVPTPQKYRVLEDHFRRVIVEELNQAIKQGQSELYFQDFISGIRLAQATIETYRN